MGTPWTTTFEIFCNWRTFVFLCYRDPLDLGKYRVVQNENDRFNELNELNFKRSINEFNLLLTLNRIWWIHGDIENHFERSRPWNQIMSVCNWAIFCEMNSYGMLRFDDWNFTRSFQTDSNMYRDLKSHHEQTSAHKEFAVDGVDADTTGKQTIQYTSWGIWHSDTEIEYALSIGSQPQDSV